MPAGNCLREKLAQGVIPREMSELVDELAGLADQYEAQLARSGDVNAESVAQVQATKAGEWRLAQRKLARRWQAIASKRVLDDLDNTPVSERNARANSYLMPEFGQRNAPQSIWSQQTFHADAAYSRMAELIEELRPRLAGLPDLFGTPRRQREMEHDIARAIYGQETKHRGSEEFGQMVKGAMDYFPDQYKRFGIVVPKIPKFLPQRHSSVRTGAVPEEEWVEFMFNRANRREMIDADTGQPFTDEKLQETLQRMYRSIVDGTGNSRSFIEKLTRERFFVFNDADGYMEWRERFSDDSSLMDAITGYIETSAMNLARVQVLGAFPNETVSAMAQRMTGPKAKRFEGVHDNMIGNNSSTLTTGDQGNQFPHFLQATRNLTGANILGSAVLPTLGDSAFMANSLRVLGTRAPFFRTAFGIVGRALNPNKSSDRIAAGKMLHIAKSTIARQGGVQRFEHDEALSNLPRKLQDSVLRMTGLTALTDANRRLAFDTMLVDLSDQKGKPFSELRSITRHTFEDFGIGEREWNVIRQNWTRDPDTGYEIINPASVVEADQQTGELFLRLINRIKEGGSPLTDPHTRYLTTFGGTDPNTGLGQVARAISQLLFWPVGIIRQQRSVMRGLARESPMTATKAAALTAIQVMSIGVLITQLRDVTRGREPRSLDNQSLYEEAFLRSGVTGIMGDFLVASLNRGGRGVNDMVGGPSLTLIGEGMHLTAGNLKDYASGEDTNAGRDAVRFLEALTPGKTAWFAELALERMIFDEMQKAMDPNAAASFRAQRSALRSRTDQEFFLPPGQGLEPR